MGDARTAGDRRNDLYSVLGESEQRPRRYGRRVSEVLLPVVRCGDCEVTLFESPSPPNEDRDPCPACGSLSRRIGIAVRDVETAPKEQTGLRAV